MSTIYVDSDTRILVSALTNQATDAVDNGATVTATIYEYTGRKFMDKAAAVDAGGGTVTFPSSGHGLAVSDYFLLTGDDDYEAEYQASAVTANSITATATYVAKTFSSNVVIAKAVDNARDISIPYIAASSGDYAGIIPDTTKFVLGRQYWVCITATDASSNVLTIKQKWVAAFHG